VANQLRTVIANEGDDLEEIGVARRTQVQAQVVVDVVDRDGVSVRCSMSAPATPCFRADG
jgi:hypothetical protein